MAQFSKTLTESTSLDCWQRMQRQMVTMPNGVRVNTNYIDQGQGKTILLLHGFDSSLLEFRRLLPLLSTNHRVIAVDLLGFGFTAREPDFLPSPERIKFHLEQFWQQQVRSPMTVVGVSMGGACALDYGLTYPEQVEKLVLVDSAGLVKQPVATKLMVPPLDRWLTNFLANPKVRQKISQQAYYDKSFASPDAWACAAAHLECPGWSEGLIAFTKSGGYGSFREQLPRLTMPSLVIWGKQDKILGTKAAGEFARLLPNSQLIWLDRCGHVPHLEQAAATAEAIAQFLAS